MPLASTKEDNWGTERCVNEFLYSRVIKFPAGTILHGLKAVEGDSQDLPRFSGHPKGYIIK